MYTYRITYKYTQKIHLKQARKRNGEEIKRHMEHDEKSHISITEFQEEEKKR